MRGTTGLNWLLPVSSIGFLAFVGTAIVLAIASDQSAWLLAAVALPGIPFVWLGLMLSLLDVSRRPDDQLSSETKMIWAAALCILNVFAFIPYWWIVMRRYPPMPDTGRQTSSATSSAATPENAPPTGQDPADVVR